MHGQDPNTLTVPGTQGYTGPGGYISDTSGYTESVLHSAAAGVIAGGMPGVAGKPPRSSPTTPR